MPTDKPNMTREQIVEKIEDICSNLLIWGKGCTDNDAGRAVMQLAYELRSVLSALRPAPAMEEPFHDLQPPMIDTELLKVKELLESVEAEIDMDACSPRLGQAMNAVHVLVFGPYGLSAPAMEEPRGCPTPGACSCVEQSPPESIDAPPVVEGEMRNLPANAKQNLPAKVKHWQELGKLTTREAVKAGIAIDPMLRMAQADGIMDEGGADLILSADAKDKSLRKAVGLLNEARDKSCDGATSEERRLLRVEIQGFFSQPDIKKLVEGI